MQSCNCMWWHQQHWSVEPKIKLVSRHTHWWWTGAHLHGENGDGNVEQKCMEMCFIHLRCVISTLPCLSNFNKIDCGEDAQYPARVAKKSQTETSIHEVDMNANRRVDLTFELPCVDPQSAWLQQSIHAWTWVIITAFKKHDVNRKHSIR